MGQICPLLSKIIRNLSPGLENNKHFKCNPGDKSLGIVEIFMKPGSQSGTYERLEQMGVPFSLFLQC